jgi:tRNA-splicing ligase RtcB (3'-phosphate/5'-hydroxy nucleic acid ligase)
MTHRADAMETRARELAIAAGVESETRVPKAGSERAGRLFGRKEAKRCFTRVAMDEWLRDRVVLLAGADLDESPTAYRRLPEVLAHHADTVKVLHTLRPFPVPMAGGGEFDPWKD